MTQVDNNEGQTEQGAAVSPAPGAWLWRTGRRIPARLSISVILFVVALGFNLYRLGNPSIWYDEAFSVELARQPLPLLWHIIFGAEPNMELYYLFLHFWLGFTGLLGLHATEFVVRFPSAIFAASNCVVVFLLGRRFVGTSAGVVGAGLYLLNDLQLVYAQQTRAYSLQLLLICIAWYALLSALTCTEHPRRWWACYVIATTLAVYTHLFSLLILLAQLAMFACLLILPNERRNSIRRLPGLIASLVITGILIIPMLLVSRNGSKTGWLPVPHPGDVYHLFLTISADSKVYLLVFVAFCILASVMAALYYVPAGREMLKRGALLDDRYEQGRFLLPALAFVCWLVVPVVLSYVISYTSTRLFSTRYLVTIVPALALLVGLGVATLRWRIVQVGLAVVLLLLAVRYVPLYYQSAQVEDWNAGTHWLTQRYQANDGLVCYENAQGCQISVEYYLHAYPGSARFTQDSPGAYSWESFGPVNPSAGYEAAVDPNALALYGAKHSRIFFIVGRVPDAAAAAKARAAQQWLDSHYHYVDQLVTRTVTIRLYITVSAQS